MKASYLFDHRLLNYLIIIRGTELFRQGSVLGGLFTMTLDRGYYLLQTDRMFPVQVS